MSHCFSSSQRLRKVGKLLRLMFAFLLPVHCGHHLNPIEGFWRVMKDAIGAGRYFHDLSQLYKRTRQVLMAHQERPIYEFHW